MRIYREFARRKGLFHIRLLLSFPCNGIIYDFVLFVNIFSKKIGNTQNGNRLHGTKMHKCSYSPSMESNCRNSRMGRVMKRLRLYTRLTARRACGLSNR